MFVFRFRWFLALLMLAPAWVGTARGAGERLWLRQAIPSASQPPIQYAYHTQPIGLEMLGPAGLSPDRGRTWTPYTPMPDFTAGLPFGYRREPFPGVVDPISGRIVTIVNSLNTPGLDPNEVEPEISLTHYYLRYRVSSDTGRTNLFDEQIIQTGHTAANAFDGVEVGKNGMFLGDIGSLPIFTSTGKLIVPSQALVLGPNGTLANPGGGYTYTDVLPVIGTWGANNRLTWNLGQRVVGDPTRTTRGLIEPTVAELPDGRFLMVMRGSNGGSLDPNYQIPSYRWSSVSADGGNTWSQAAPWTYDDGQAFFSPSSMSQLLRHSSGRVFWVGNINETNSQGNGPRLPLVMGEVDPVTLRLKKSSLLTIDTRRLGDPQQVDISFFRAIEDRASGDIILTSPRYLNNYQSSTWTTYRIQFAAASAVQRDSSAFNSQYNGDVYNPGLPGYTEDGGWTTAPSTDGDILSFQSSVGSSHGFFESGAWPGAVSDSVGWTLEVRLKIENDAAEGEYGAFNFFVGDGAPGNSRVAFRIGKSFFGTNTGGSGATAVLDTSNNTDGFHTFRVAQLASSDDFLIWRDGVLLDSFAVGSHAIGSGLWWGDGSGLVGGPTVRVDYFRFDNTGGYEPVTAPPAVPGDFDGDGDVDGADFVAWQTHFPTPGGASLATGDADGDGDVDGADFVVWQTNFPFTPSSSVSPMPEPSSLALLASMGIFAAGIRFRFSNPGRLAKK